MTAPATFPLAEAERERLGRLRAEWELADLRARLAHDALKQAGMLVANSRAITTDFHIDWERGLIIVDSPSENSNG